MSHFAAKIREKEEKGEREGEFIENGSREESGFPDFWL